MANLFATKPLDRLMNESQETGEHCLKRTLGPVSLIMLGIGAIIGAGLFVRTADAIADRSGPSVTIAFIVAGFGCAFAGLREHVDGPLQAIKDGANHVHADAAAGHFGDFTCGGEAGLENEIHDFRIRKAVHVRLFEEAGLYSVFAHAIEVDAAAVILDFKDELRPLVIGIEIDVVGICLGGGIKDRLLLEIVGV